MSQTTSAVSSRSTASLSGSTRTLAAGTPYAVPLLVVFVADRTPAAASRARSCAQSEAPWLGVTPSVLAAHRAYQDFGDVTGTKALFVLSIEPPTSAYCGALRPRGNAGAPWLRLRPPQIQCRLPSSLTSVSYTHLDVYKRQGVHIALVLAEFGAVDTELEPPGVEVGARGELRQGPGGATGEREWFVGVLPAVGVDP